MGAPELGLAAADTLRFTTAGSVDDGKSTLIGRLLYDSKAILEDQFSALERVSQRRGADSVDLSLLTDGLIAEREQGITIDVAYRYFATARRRFIVADAPGHEQYTRNMATAASTAQLAIILVDATKGVLAQTRRHLLISYLLGVRHFVAAINKMDRVDYSYERFSALSQELADVSARVGVEQVHIVPLSALHGDMVTERGARMPWYDGPTLLELLESVDAAPESAAELRFPVQLVARAQSDGAGRGYMGRIESGSVRVGDAVTVLPSGLTTQVSAIYSHTAPLTSAGAPQSVTIALSDELDISRGDMIVRSAERPAQVLRSLTAQVCWMDTEPMRADRAYVLKHTTRSVRAQVSAFVDRVDVSNLQRVEQTGQLVLNDIGTVTLKLAQPLAADRYRDNRAAGSFILIDPASNHTVAAGMVL